MGRSSGFSTSAGAGSAFFHRQSLASERRLVQEQVLGGEQPHVGRHHIAGGQVDDIARHQQLERNFRFRPAAHHRRRGADHRLELLGRVIGAHFLEEAQHHAQHHHDENDHHCAQVAGEERDHTQRDQQDDQRILDVMQQAHQGGLALFARDLVRPDLLQARIGFRLAQAF